MRIFSIMSVLMVLFIVSNVSGEVCIRYDHSSTCSSYPITDFYIGLPVSQSEGSIIRELDMTTSHGLIKALDERIDLGSSLFFSAYRNGGWHSQLGISANLRYHLNDEFNLDLSPGLILTDSPYQEGFPGYTAELSVSWKDWVGLAARMDIVDTYSGQDQVLHVGLRFGSYGGMGLTSVGIVGGGIAYMVNRMD